MPRIARLKFHDPEEGYYHIISRIVLKSFLLEEGEKEYFLSLLKKLSQVYFVKVQGFTIMSNHVHLICQMIPGDVINDDELKKRFEKYYNEGKPLKKRRVFFKHDYEDYRKRWGDVSKFVQDLKQRFSRWYNKKHNGHGHVWSERFKNVLLNGDRALLACA